MRDSLETLMLEYGKNESVADMFGILLYTDEHPNIKKVLRDDDYWMAFDEITGKRFCVFSVRPERGRYELPNFSPGTFGMMVRIWKEPRENKKLLELFELKDTKNLPVLLLFTKIEDEFLTIELPLSDDSEVDAQKSITEKLKIASSVLEQVKVENIKSPEGLFAAMSLRIDDDNKWKRVTNILEIYKKLKEFLL